MSTAWMQRHRLPLAACLIVLLSSMLLVREGVAQWRVLSQWQALAQTAVSLQGDTTLNLERLRQSGQARQIELLEVVTQGEAWHLRGQVGDEQALLGWVRALQAEGAQPLQWGLEQDAQGMRFDLVLRP
ncbi:type II secretion system protein GspM [Pseudomonas kermanshahensis]|uniref:type II secretion system protein GspM n=1 Tax=Pseudomonas kermanshahensis TaxID=2745482 RepID=UPI0020927E12|nr:type II secretion system protein GspM [Pseudomonas kermanshahensis]USS57057.1 type II secretion system protein GspM [Pseudomonas kermanshahensis]